MHLSDLLSVRTNNLLNSHFIKHLVEKLLEYIIIWHLTQVRGVIGVTLEQGGSGNLPIVLQQELHQELPGKLTNVYLSEAYYIVYLIMIMLDPGLVKATQCSSIIWSILCQYFCNL